ncbi:MAG: di-trans,poly-cis-decaprenylcistransferase [Gammaproteobacteria bacterium]|nr:di-trans,poly-cis-decaprenylcistransferase [Gammaproteobacteria bacterium]
MKVSVGHLAIIMDGNGRWARLRGLPRTAGHKAGLNAVQGVMRACEPHQIRHLTLFAFSSENWRRPRKEVNLLMDLFVTTIKKELAELVKKNICLKFIGDIDAFELRLKQRIRQAEYETANNDGLHLNIAVNYGGRWDITQAAKKMAQRVQDGELQVDDINTDTFAGFLCLNEIPYPDLLIRTGGESRISNFLIWQLAYSELYFTDCLWPDFNADELAKAVDWYAGRQRRFGETPEQVSLGTGKSHA